MISVKDPVCGKKFDICDVRAHEDYRGWAYFFCSDKCRQKFLIHRDRFTGVEQGVRPNVAPAHHKPGTVR